MASTASLSWLKECRLKQLRHNPIIHSLAEQYVSQGPLGRRNRRYRWAFSRSTSVSCDICRGLRKWPFRPPKLEYRQNALSRFESMLRGMLWVEQPHTTLNPARNHSGRMMQRAPTTTPCSAAKTGSVWPPEERQDATPVDLQHANDTAVSVARRGDVTRSSSKSVKGGEFGLEPSEPPEHGP